MAKVAVSSVAAIAAAVIAPSVVYATATLNYDNLNNSAGAYFYDLGWGFHGGSDGYGQYYQGLDFSDTRSFSHGPEDGFAGTGKSQGSFQYVPSNPGVGGVLNKFKINGGGSAEVTASNSSNHYYEQAYGNPYNYVYFHLDTSTEWHWEADVKGQSTAGYSNQGYYQMFIYDSGWANNYANDYAGSYNGSGDFNYHTSQTGTLPAGDYIFYAGAGGSIFNWRDTGGTGSASGSISNGVFTFGKIPTPGAGALGAVVGLAVLRRRRS